MTTINTALFQFALSAIAGGLAEIEKGRPDGAVAIRVALESLQRHVATKQPGGST